MVNLNDISAFYFVGIGGIGMSALARYFNMQKKTVMGYDRVATPLTNALENEGIAITFDDKVEDLPKEIRDKKNVLVVYTPAISRANTLLDYFISHNFTVVKRAALLGQVSQNSFCLAVSGTHGKTTTSAILGHLLVASDMPVTVFLGGVSENYGSNFIFRGKDITVVEADEYDRSFLQLNPDVVCITSMDADHLDIYGDASEIESAFKSFVALVDQDDHILIKLGLDLPGKTVAIEETADYEVQNLKVVDGLYQFDLKTPETVVEDITFNLPGRHNVLNAVMAFGMARLAGASTESLVAGLRSFKGVNRRFTYKIKTDSLVLIDDYAHHPTELAALHQAVTEMYPEDRKQIVFQPHLYSRTRDFGEAFAESLSLFDEVVLLDIYPAREKPIAGITSKWLIEHISVAEKQIVKKEEIAEVMASSRSRIKLLVGAGDIGNEVDKVVKTLSYEA